MGGKGRVAGDESRSEVQLCVCLLEAEAGLRESPLSFSFSLFLTLSQLLTRASALVKDVIPLSDLGEEERPFGKAASSFSTIASSCCEPSSAARRVEHRER